MRVTHILAAPLALLLVCVPALPLSVASEDLVVRRSGGDLIHVTAPRLHFLTGRTLERLKNAATVPFDFQLTMFAGSKSFAIQRSLERFVVSYDIWEEKFSVIGVRGAHKSGPLLTANAAEAWCLQNILLSASNVPSDKDLWVRLEIRTSEPKPVVAEPVDSGISLATLIDVFSRPTQVRQDHWAFDAGPFHLAELRP